jgi:signal transduction histidine kinase
VDISVTEQDSTACLRVTSAGPPISENLLHRGSEDDSSRGIGLSVVRWIATAHGGKLDYVQDAGRNVMVMCLPRTNR